MIGNLSSATNFAVFIQRPNMKDPVKHTVLANLAGMTSSSLGRDSQYVLVKGIQLLTGEFL